MSREEKLNTALESKSNSLLDKHREDRKQLENINAELSNEVIRRCRIIDANEKEIAKLKEKLANSVSKSDVEAVIKSFHTDDEVSLASVFSKIKKLLKSE